MARRPSPRSPSPRPTSSDGPVRQCAACRQRLPAHRLLRLAVGPHARVVADPFRRMPGRGVHVCPRPGCIRSAVDRGAPTRGFKEPVTADADELVASAARGLHRRWLQLLGVARRAGRLAAGMDEVLRGLAAGELAVVVLAEDTSARSRGDVEAAALRAGVRVLQAGAGKDAVGKLLGRVDTAVLGLPRGQQASEVIFLHDAVVELGGVPPDAVPDDGSPREHEDAKPVETSSRGT